MKKIIFTDKAPTPIGPYSQATHPPIYNTLSHAPSHTHSYTPSNTLSHTHSHSLFPPSPPPPPPRHHHYRAAAHPTHHPNHPQKQQQNHWQQLMPPCLSEHSMLPLDEHSGWCELQVRHRARFFWLVPKSNFDWDILKYLTDEHFIVWFASRNVVIHVTYTKRCL